MNKTVYATIFFCFQCFTVIAQKPRLPYPIILIHGLGGNSGSWYDFASYLQTQAGIETSLNDSRREPWANNELRFCLNADGDRSRSAYWNDISDQTRVDLLWNTDLYFIEFDACDRSNQAGITKQGIALQKAIKYVLEKTGAEEVILLGHSMGGLTAREYIQNSANWQSDGQHHVAKLVTSGTPHGGSNFTGLGVGALADLLGILEFSETSEAARDLRYQYISLQNGVFLFGGREEGSVIFRGLPLYQNIDVNCNGRTGDFVVGLNQKSFPQDIPITCIVATDALVTFPIVDDEREDTGFSYKTDKEPLALPLWLLRSQNHDSDSLPD